MPEASVAQQVMEIEISGPAGANRLYVCTGTADINIRVQNASQTETWTFFVGPALQTAQFRRAVASASIAGSSFHLGQAPTGPFEHGEFVRSVEADWDDERGQTEVRAEVFGFAGGTNTILHLQRLAFSVSILAAV
jgi:hypothetical protein